MHLHRPAVQQQELEHYDDNLEHSQWQTMMLPRLQLPRELPSGDGSIWGTIDDIEGHYPEVLMDEVFGPGTSSALLIWPGRLAAQLGASGFVRSRQRSPLRAQCRLQASQVPRTDAANAICANPDDDERGPWLPGDPCANKPHSQGT